MQTLALANELIPSVKSGDKICTIREGTRDIALGNLLFEAVGTDETVEVSVRSVIHKTLGELTDVEAQMDCVDTAEEMADVLRNFYPDINDDSEITIVIFHLVEQCTSSMERVYLLYFLDSKKFASNVCQGSTEHGTVRPRVALDSRYIYKATTVNGLWFVSWYTHWPFYLPEEKHNALYVLAYDEDGVLTPDFNIVFTVDELKDHFKGYTLNTNYERVPIK
jgi:hypothetical protein